MLSMRKEKHRLCPVERAGGRINMAGEVGFASFKGPRIFWGKTLLLEKSSYKRGNVNGERKNKFNVLCSRLSSPPLSV